MAPTRRYLRITKYSVLEVRIYLDQPSQRQWLLDPRDGVLSRIFQAIRPYVLPKLREENERTKGKSKRPKGVKDTVTQDDFEVSIFLTDISTPHTLLTKSKDFHTRQERMKSNSGKLTGWLGKGTDDHPVNVDEDDEPVRIREESDDEDVTNLDDFPVTRPSDGRGKRSRSNNDQVVELEDVSDDEGFQTQTGPASKRARIGQEDDTGEEQADKKKLGLNTAYDGFRIYGRVLCLIVKRKGVKGRLTGPAAEQSEQRMLENWVSTQAAQEQGVGDD